MGARPMASSQVVAQKKDVLYEVSWQCEMVVPSSAAPLERRELSSFTVLLEQDNSAIGVEMHPSLGVNASMLVTQAVMSLLQQIPDGTTGSSKFTAFVLGCLPSCRYAKYQCGLP